MGSADPFFVANMSTNSTPSVAIDAKFRQRFAGILARWRSGTLTAEDKKFLDTITLARTEYLSISEEFSLRHGLELVDCKLQLTECATAVHEYLGGRVDDWVTESWGRQYITKMRSTSNFIVLSALTRSYCL